LDFKFIFKLSCLTGLLWLACGDVPRDNILDPRNPDSITAQKVMIEAFVNTSNPLSVNEYALQALDSLSSLYENRIIIAEYHRNTAEYSDDYHTEKNELLYQHYVARFDNFKGVPDIFINGTSQRIQGASSASYSVFRLEEALQGEILKNTYFLIQPACSREGNTVSPSVRIARLGRQPARQIIIKALIVSHINDPFLKRVVGSAVESQIITQLSPGEQKRIMLPEMRLDDGSASSLIIYVTNADATEIYQCESIEIE
jgi:hypothetical protein